jgi:hypothetical protein
MDDPVRRLQYLRRVAVTLPVEHTKPLSLPLHRPPKAFIWLGLLAVFFPLPTVSESADLPLKLPEISSAPLVNTFASVWLVERTEDSDVYSNGLRVCNTFATSHRRRSYQLFSQASLGSQPTESRSEPAGIVYHTTESHLAPFRADTNPALKRAGTALLEYVRRRRSYHFVIDRFGRVYRVVAETDTADHAGHSIWADSRWIYLDLNHSFLGVAFEAQSRLDNGQPIVTAAQTHAGRVLTEWLRARYRIPASNCVTHAQVSVNPRNHEIGYHTDWSAGFPFADLGLPDNYAQVLPSVHLFGFHADGVRPWSGLAAAEMLLEREAASQSLSLKQYRNILHHRYGELAVALHPDS